MRPELTSTRLRELLSYAADTGVWTRLVSTASNAQAGSTTTGSLNGHGYRVIFIAGHRYYAHRLAWFYVMNTWPEHEIDHINGDRTDNRFANLRPATDSQNRFNAAARGGKSGIKGVSSKAGKWVATIGAGGVQYHLGVFNTKEEARAAYCARSILLHGKFSKLHVALAGRLSLHVKKTL